MHEARFHICNHNGKVAVWCHRCRGHMVMVDRTLREVFDSMQGHERDVHWQDDVALSG